MLPAPPRSYLKRKRYLNVSAETIARTLRCIAHEKGILGTEFQILERATVMARSVDAACFVAANKSSEARYRMMIENKTRELCQGLILQSMLGGPPRAAHGDGMPVRDAKAETEIDGDRGMSSDDLADNGDWLAQ
jgi:hypothetical protein